jgi:hypothetical protein
LGADRHDRRDLHACWLLVDLKNDILEHLYSDRLD